MGNIQTVGPNEALVVSGGCCRPSKREVIVGGWCWNTWMLTNIQRISLQVMTLNPKCEHVQSRHGVPVTVTGVVHCKIMSAPEFLPLAAEQFLGKSVDHIKSVVLQTVEGHMRAVIGTQTIEDICKKRQELASMIREATTKDLSRMGIDIMSLTIKDIKDDVEYLKSAGKRTAALVKRDAAVETARAENEAAQVEANCKREIEERQLQNESKLSQQAHEMEKAKAKSNDEVGKIKAEATKSFDLQLASLQKGIREIEMEVTEIECVGEIEIQKIESERRKTELEIDISLPNKSEIYRMQKEAEANIAKKEAETVAREFKIQTVGKAKAEAAKIEGAAEAEGLKLVAEARKEYNEAAILYDMLEALPKIAAEIASPLSNFEEIVLISDQNDNGNNHHNTGSKAGEGDKKTGKATSGYAAEAAMLSSSLPLAIRAVGGSEQTYTGLLSSILQLQRSN